jgi:hypothetical protein
MSHAKKIKLNPKNFLAAVSCFSSTTCWKPVDTLSFEIKFEISSSPNWIFNLQTSISKLIFAGYTGSKNPV